MNQTNPQKPTLEELRATKPWWAKSPPGMSVKMRQPDFDPVWGFGPVVFEHLKDGQPIASFTIPFCHTAEAFAVRLLIHLHGSRQAAAEALAKEPVVEEVA